MKDFLSESKSKSDVEMTSDDVVVNISQPDVNMMTEDQIQEEIGELK